MAVIFCHIWFILCNPILMYFLHALCRKSVFLVSLLLIFSFTSFSSFAVVNVLFFFPHHISLQPTQVHLNFAGSNRKEDVISCPFSLVRWLRSYICACFWKIIQLFLFLKVQLLLWPVLYFLWFVLSVVIQPFYLFKN